MVGTKIKKVVNILWKLEIVLTVIAFVLAILGFANADSAEAYKAEGTYGVMLVVFIVIMAVVCAVSLFAFYVKKLFLEGFGQLVEKSESIESMMKKN